MADNENELLADTGYAIYALLEQIATGPDDSRILQTLGSVINEGDRFKIWSTSTGLLIPGHGSLDYRVREAVSLSKTLHSFLIDLRDNLEEVRDLLDSQSISVPEAENGAAEIDDEVDEDDDTLINPDQIMIILFMSIRDIVDRLFRLATKLRSPETRLRSSRAQKFQQLDGGVDLFASFAEFEHDYVASVFRQYRRGPKLADLAEQETSPDSDSKLRIDDEASGYLIERIAFANLARRRQFAYWQHHSLKLEKHTEAAIAVRKSARSTKDASFLPASFDPRPANAAPAMTISTATQLLQPTRDFSDLTSMASMSEYVPSPAEAYGESVIFPPPPHVPMDSEFFMCPYCFTTCARKTLGTKAWQAHLIHDLRPYICTYGDCITPHQLYDSKADWIQHETASHTSTWTCSVHPDKVFDDIVMFRLHVADGHIQNALIDGNIQQAAVIESIDKIGRPCPICMRLDLPTPQLSDHIASHLEKLAIFSLPKHTCMTETNANSQNSNKANGEEDSRDFDTRSNLSFASTPLALLDGSSLPEVDIRQQSTQQPEDLELTYQRELAENEETLGTYHIRTLDTVVKLGDFYTGHDQLDQAAEMYIRALAGREKTSGSDPKFNLDVVSKLGSTYLNQGKHEKAEQMYMRVLAGYEEKLGPEHTSTLNAVDDLASVYYDQGQLDRAEQMYLRALAGFEKTSGPDPRFHLDIVTKLGNIYREQRQPDKAEQMYLRALKRHEETFGSHHISTLAIVDDLATFYRDQDQLDKAEQMYKRALTGFEEVLGPDHTKTLYAAIDLGVIYHGQGMLEQAEQTMLRAVNALDNDDPLKYFGMHILATQYSEVGRREEAIKLLEQVVQARKRVLGEEHPDTLASIHGLAMLHSKSKRYQEAVQLLEQLVKVHKSKLGEEHPATLNSMEALAQLYSEMGQMKEAQQLRAQIAQVNLVKRDLQERDTTT